MGKVKKRVQGKTVNPRGQKNRDRGDRHHGKKKHTWKSVRDKKNSKLSGKQEESRGPGLTSSQVPKELTSSSSLRSRMLDRLSIARFRSLNADIDASPQTPKTNPLSRKETFQSYHTGFESASSLWKQHPLDLISKWILASVPKTQVVADFGCGSGRLATLIPNRTYSFDLHALSDHVIEADMSNVPLEDSSVHVVVFCLSLMGSDVTPFLNEARRVLVDGGRVKIAEAAARLNGPNMRKFVSGMREIGFKKTSVNEIGGSHGNHVFVIMEFKKTSVSRSKGKVLLGACVYKKR